MPDACPMPDARCIRGFCCREVASCTSLSVWKRANNFEAVDAYCARRVLKSGRTCVETAYENDVEHVDHAELIERSLADQYFHA